MTEKRFDRRCCAMEREGQKRMLKCELLVVSKQKMAAIGHFFGTRVAPIA